MEKSTITLTRKIQLLIDLPPGGEDRDLGKAVPLPKPLFPCG